jgi:hypothetical protein
VHLEPIASEPEHLVLPALKVVPSNKALLRAKKNGAAFGKCIQEGPSFEDNVTVYRYPWVGEMLKPNEHVINRIFERTKPNGWRTRERNHTRAQVSEQ